MSAARLALFGITGRMGQSLVRALREEAWAAEFQLSGALASAGSPHLNCDAALDGVPTGVKVSADLNRALERAQVALEFSVGDALPDHARACAAAGVPLLVGSTGSSAGVREALSLAAREVAVLVAPNTSVGVAVVARLAAIATRALGADFDIEILEAHHRTKRDAPSGTALALGEAVAEARGRSLSDIAVFERHRQHTDRRGTHRAVRGRRRARRDHPPGQRPGDIRARRAAGRRLVDWPAGGPVQHAEYARSEIGIDSDRVHR
jgi:4-hydroxy-tetrahydrodipicolinate reductase